MEIHKTIDPAKWREDLLIVGFFAPLEKACSLYFHQVYGDPELRVEIKHKLDIANNGLKLQIRLIRADFYILSTEIAFKDEQIQGSLRQHGFDLQTMLGMTFNDICNSMFMELNRRIYKDYFIKSIIKPKPEENVTVDSEVQAHSDERQTASQETGGSAPASS